MRGSITAPNGVPELNGRCGGEIFAMGSDWWVSTCWNNVRGIMEFDVRYLPAYTFRRVILSLRDTGSAASGELQTTRVLGYRGDGWLTVDDWGSPAAHVLTVTRPDVAGTTEHDVTEFVNAELRSGSGYVGFRLEPGGPSTFEAFGLWGNLRLE